MKRILIIIIAVLISLFLLWKIKDLGTANRLAKRIAQTPAERLEQLADSLSAEGRLRLIMDLTVHPQRPVHTKAVMLLGMMGDGKAVDLLLQLLADTKAYKREAALASLKSLTGRDFGPDPQVWKKWLMAGGGDSLKLLKQK